MPKKRIGETSYKETAFGIIPRSKLIPLEIEGIKRAWELILKQRKSGKIPLTEVFLKKLHKTGFGWIFPVFGGTLRKIDVSVSAHTPPKSFLIPQLLEDFLEDAKIRIKNLPAIDESNFFSEIISLLAWAHHRFVWIHPFQDYNGRIGRLFISILLLNLDLPPIEMKVETPAGRKRYIQALREADNGDHKKLEGLLDDALMEAIKSYFPS